jgi:hypothetical protein
MSAIRSLTEGPSHAPLSILLPTAMLGKRLLPQHRMGGQQISLLGGIYPKSSAEAQRHSAEYAPPCR